MGRTLDELCEQASMDADCGAWASAAIVEAYELGSKEATKDAYDCGWADGHQAGQQMERA